MALLRVHRRLRSRRLPRNTPVLSLALLSILAVSGCGVAQGVADREAPTFESIATAAQPVEMPADPGKRLQVFETAGGLSPVFASMTGMTPPDIDFREHRVVLADLGTRPSAGHSVRVTDVRWQGDRLTVKLLEQRPGQGCMTASVVTRPFVFVRIPAAGGPVLFEERVERVSCD